MALKPISPEDRVYFELKRIKKEIDLLMQIIVSSRKDKDCRKQQYDWKAASKKRIEECREERRKNGI